MCHVFKVVIGLLIATTAFAADPEFAASGGLKSFNLDYDGVGSTVSGKTGLQAGVIGFVPFTEVVQLRSGFLYTQRNVEVTTGGSKLDINTSWVDIPATLYLKFSEFGGAFIGPILSMNISKECSVAGGTCAVNELNTLSVPITFGVSFKFAPQMGAELAYEMQSGKYALGLKDSRAIGANFLYFFE